ncbi:MAG: AAA family ATPase [Myxococcales bacterium]|nr:AAA family ATPase [Myxococcales bacterium]
MLSRIQIKGFKSIREAKVELGAFNVFVGPNGAGKSNLLEAIGVLGAAAKGRVDDEALLRRGVRPGVPALYKSSFRQQRIPPQIDIEAQSRTGPASLRILLRNPVRDSGEGWSFFSESLKHKGRRLAGRSEANRHRGNPEQGRVALEMADLDPKQPAAALVRRLQDFAIYAPTTGVLRGTVPDPQQREPIGLSGGRLPEAALEVLRNTTKQQRGEYFDLLGWVERWGVRAAADAPIARSVPTPRRVLQFTDRYMADGRNVLTAYDASEGSLFVLFALVVSLHPSIPPTVAIDNMDHGLNPRLARALVTKMSEWVLKQADRQLLVTAHNPSLLDGLPLQDDRVRLFVVDRALNGETVINRIIVTPAILERAREGWTLSRMWVAGHLGGVPDV